MPLNHWTSRQVETALQMFPDTTCPCRALSDVASRCTPGRRKLLLMWNRYHLYQAVGFAPRGMTVGSVRVGSIRRTSFSWTSSFIRLKASLRAAASDCSLASMVAK
eukprot:9485762-Pyramimonas_sp.AAC.1